MPDEPLKPATRESLIQTLAYGLRFEGRKRIHHADELMAQIAAEKLADHIDRANLVVMQKPPATALSWPRTPPTPEGE